MISNHRHSILTQTKFISSIFSNANSIIDETEFASANGRFATFSETGGSSRENRTELWGASVSITRLNLSTFTSSSIEWRKNADTYILENINILNVVVQRFTCWPEIIRCFSIPVCFFIVVTSGSVRRWMDGSGETGMLEKCNSSMPLSWSYRM